MPRFTRLALALAAALVVVLALNLERPAPPAPGPTDTAPGTAPGTAPDSAPADHSESRWSRSPDDGKPVRQPNPWFFTERAWPRMEIPREAWRTAQLQARALKAERDGARTSWFLRGPTNIGGRITALAVDPRDHDVVYAGAAEGGVMRTRDGGQSWTMTFDDQASLAIGAVVLDPADPDVVYAGTGEVNPGGGSVAYGGTGLYRSDDQGETWVGLGLEEVGAIGRIVIDPTNPQRIFVAAMGELWAGGPHRGVYRSEDGGQTWQLVLQLGETTGCVDLILRPDQPQTVLAAMWQRIRTPERYDYGGPECGVWRTDDGGDTWSVVGGGLPAPDADDGRIGLALCANEPDRMYAVYADRIGYFDGLYRSDDGGASWTRTSDWALNNVFASYGWWFGNVRCHPDDPDIVFVLGLDFYRSLNGGASWSETSGGMHVDHHALQWGSLPERVIYAGNDGGVYRSTNGGSVWTMLPDQPITQVYRLGLDASNPDRLYLGGQDISTVRTLSGALDDWETIFGGDGFQPLIHPENSNRIWVQYQYGGLYYSSNGGGSFSYAGGGIGGGDRAGWNAPHVQDPTDPDRIATSAPTASIATSGNTSWTAISGDLTGGPHQDQNGQVRGTLTTIAVSPLDADVLWTGSDDGHVHVSVSGGAAGPTCPPACPSAGSPACAATRSTARPPTSPSAASAGTSRCPTCSVTTDLGASWQPIAGNLPEAPVNDLLAHPDRPGLLFVATDVGVFRTTAAPTWEVVAPGLPNVVVTHLAYSEARSELLAGTYGRSVWAVPVTTVTAAPAVAVAGPGRLRPAFPNPTSSGTTLAWELGRGGDVTVEVFTVSGRRLWRTTVGGVAAGAGQPVLGRPRPAGTAGGGRRVHGAGHGGR